ncbi:MAG: hypothetical protein KKB20_24130 [Proteobacteria bacterium]|nr:hypothetical protein [Pseudomonadota bacterium]
MKIDLHVHTRHYSGCSGIEADELLEHAAGVGLDGLALTEHGILWPEDKLAPLREKAAEIGLLLLAGQEITCLERGRRQDFLVFGMTVSLGSLESPLELIERVHGEGGVVVAAHPFKPSRLGAGYHGVGDDIVDLAIDAVELFHPDHDRQARAKVRAAAKILNIPMTGGSDSHALYSLGYCSTRFFNPIRTEDDLVREIRAGRMEPLNGLK